MVSKLEELAREYGDRESENYRYDMIDIKEAYSAGFEKALTLLLEEVKKYSDVEIKGYVSTERLQQIAKELIGE